MIQKLSLSSLIYMLCIYLFSLAVFADHPDHPFLSRYPNSDMATKDVKSFNEYNLIIGVGKGIELNSTKIQGKVTRMRYRNPKDRSILEIFANYEIALKKADLNIIFKCVEKDCGPAYASSSWNNTTGFSVKSGNNSRYLAGSLRNEEGIEVYVAIMVGPHQHQVDIIEVSAMEDDLVVVDASALAKGIDLYGFVSVYGILFDTGKSAIKPESKTALDAIADLLKERKEMKLFVVGHTDSVGEFDFNLKLSNQRASAIVYALTSDYGINVNRLVGQGVGPLAPKATNATEDGRAKNRRVELVLR